MTRRDGRPHGSDRSNGATIVYGGPDGITPRVWPRALQPHRSPCRQDDSKGYRQHRCSATHADQVESYRLWREGAMRAAEDATSGYATELDDYWRDNVRPTFKTYLTSMRQEHDS